MRNLPTTAIGKKNGANFSPVPSVWSEISLYRSPRRPKRHLNPRVPRAIKNNRVHHVSPSCAAANPSVSRRWPAISCGRSRSSAQFRPSKIDLGGHATRFPLSEMDRAARLEPLLACCIASALILDPPPYELLHHLITSIYDEGINSSFHWKISRFGQCTTRWLVRRPPVFRTCTSAAKKMEVKKLGMSASVIAVTESKYGLFPDVFSTLLTSIIQFYAAAKKKSTSHLGRTWVSLAILVVACWLKMCDSQEFHYIMQRCFLENT